MLLAFNKPYGVLSQFTAAKATAFSRGLDAVPARGGAAMPRAGGGDAERSRPLTKQEPEHRTLADFGFSKQVYPIGRLDWDSEGLLLLSDEKEWNDFLLHPRYEHERVYHAQVEGIATEEAMATLRKGMLIQGRKTRPCKARLLSDPGYPPRNPPIRFRLTVPTSWIELKLTEGKNRQVRRMTAVAGFPTLRLIRTAIGTCELGDLASGKWYELNSHQRQLLKTAKPAKEIK